MKKNILAHSIQGVSALMVACTLNAHAQTDVDSTSSPAASLITEEVLVTARRKEETLIEIPMAVSSISATEIADRNYTSASDIYRTLAGAASPRGQLILRGLSGGNSSAPGTTTTFVDDIPYSFTNLSDVERVEVLRGPQGTLYGSNAIGGTVRIITKQPQLNEFEVFSNIQASTEADVDGVSSNGTLGVNIPLIEDKLALRVSANREHEKLQMVNMNTGLQGSVDRGFVRARLLWQINEQMDMTFGYARVNYSDRGTDTGDRSTPGYRYTYSLTENTSAPYGYDVAFDTVDCDPAAERPACMGGNAPISASGVPAKYQIWESIDGWYKSQSDLYTLNFNHDNLFDLATLTYAGSYRKFDTQSLDNWSRLDADDLFKTWIINDDFYNETTHEVRLQNIDASSPLSWTVGMFYDKVETDNALNNQNQYHEAGDIASAVAMNWWWGIDVTQLGIDTFGNPQNNWRNSVIKDRAEELAYFADVAYTFDIGAAGELELNAGVRHYELEDEYHGETMGLWSENVTQTAGEESGERYKFSASWRPTDTMSVYALYSEGYRPGGNNGPLAGSCENDPNASQRKDRYTSDAIDNYELGLKMSAMDGRVNFATAVYQIDWTDIKTNVYMPTCGFSFTANGGEARSRGWEFESTALLTDSLKMTFNTSYTNSVVLEDNDAISAEAGDDMTMVPEWNAYLALDQSFTLFNKPMSVRGDYTYYGEYKTHFNVRDEDVVPAYSYFNLSGRVELSDNLQLSAHLNNVFDKEAISYKRARSRSESNTTAQQYINYLSGRTLAIRLDMTFD
ncbi:TonB-dependent receptor [Simiduia agarivorans]|uniref:Outer membrane TonB-dependent receptor n=1 Tax=Simiduia agarivorans (strain DSM 21679 / JCM 13881 / BCRC 17597 / SA1) TaxID=1117647 RepID=K4KN75_SIMAS|nr:TonB-dependent receptor [Simiduia agarivorans]AFU99568.1 putative Outer membrane TonB-dependent receptor [Simiduia agarivorans SA1 = DSM 21679]